MENTGLSDRKIIDIAIQVAAKNGFSLKNIDISSFYYAYCTMKSVQAPFVKEGVYGLIFNHDFAKAFFGEEVFGNEKEPYWKTNLKELVLSENPIEKIHEFLLVEYPEELENLNKQP